MAIKISWGLAEDKYENQLKYHDNSDSVTAASSCCHKLSQTIAVLLVRTHAVFLMINRGRSTINHCGWNK